MSACCNQLWCAGCFLLLFVAKLPAVFRCVCGKEHACLYVSGSGAAGTIREVRIRHSLYWALGRRVGRWANQSADARRGEVVVQYWCSPSGVAQDRPLCFTSVLRPRDNLVKFLSAGRRTGAVYYLFVDLHARLVPDIPPPRGGGATLVDFERTALNAKGPLVTALRLLMTGSDVVEDGECCTAFACVLWGEDLL